MKIKGHTIIELTDVNTGAKERYEKDNMVTHALDKYFEDIGAFNISPLYNSDVRNNLIPRLLGGLLLLDTPLTENADNIICPSGVEMVGNGSYNVSSGNEDLVTEMGTYDQLESGWMSDGKLAMVWNFSQNQANGKDANQSIACVCLTSANHGYIGEGNATSLRAKSERKRDYDLAGTAQSISIDGNGNQYSRVVRASRTSNTITMIDYYNFYRTAGHENEHMSETGKVKLVTSKQPIKKLDMRYGAGSQYIPTTEVEVSLPSGFVSTLNHGNPYWSNKYGGKFVMITGFRGVDYGQGQFARWYGSTPIQVVIINEDNTISSYSVASPTGANVDIELDSIIVAGTTLVIGDHNTGKTWFIDMNNQADKDEIDGILSQIDFVYPTQGVAQGTGGKIDINERTIYPNNSYRNSSNRHTCYNFLTDNPLVNCRLWGENTGINKTTNYLATINNLETPIKKTSSKMMKVTYVLSFDDGE